MYWPFRLKLRHQLTHNRNDASNLGQGCFAANLLPEEVVSVMFELLSGFNKVFAYASGLNATSERPISVFRVWPPNILYPVLPTKYSQKAPCPPKNAKKPLSSKLNVTKSRKGEPPCLINVACRANSTPDSPLMRGLGSPPQLGLTLLIGCPEKFLLAEYLIQKAACIRREHKLLIQICECRNKAL